MRERLFQLSTNCVGDSKTLMILHGPETASNRVVMREQEEWCKCGTANTPVVARSSDHATWVAGTLHERDDSVAHHGHGTGGEAQSPGACRPCRPPGAPKGEGFQKGVLSTF